MASLILADLGIEPYLDKRGGAKSQFRAALTEYMIMLTVAEADCMESTTTKRIKTNINSGVV